MRCRGQHWHGFVSHYEDLVEGYSTVEVLLSLSPPLWLSASLSLRLSVSPTVCRCISLSLDLVVTTHITVRYLRLLRLGVYQPLNIRKAEDCYALKDGWDAARLHRTIVSRSRLISSRLYRDK